MWTSSEVVAARWASSMSPRLKLLPPPAFVWQFRQVSLLGMRISTAAWSTETVMFAVSGTKAKAPLPVASVRL